MTAIVFSLYASKLNFTNYTNYNWVAARDVRADFSTARIKADAQGALPLEARPPDYEFRTSRLH